MGKADLKATEMLNLHTLSHYNDVPIASWPLCPFPSHFGAATSSYISIHIFISLFTQTESFFQNSANPTSHVPELVLSNLSTPLGLSTGRLLQRLFPPLPQIVGRQVVAIHNQRDFVFFRRFRYMFAVRETEQSRTVAKTQGRDEDLRTKMQEIGPRFTLKLRWLKRGALGTGRRKGGMGITAGNLLAGTAPTNINAEMEGADETDLEKDAAEELSEQDKQNETLAIQEMLEHLGDTESLIPSSYLAEHRIEASSTLKSDQQPIQDPSQEHSESISQEAPFSKKRKRTRTHSPGGTIRIPEFSMPTEIKKSQLPQHRNFKKGASILDSLAMTVGYGRGGTEKDQKEWEWNARMQVSRRRFVL